MFAQQAAPTRWVPIGQTQIDVDLRGASILAADEEREPTHLAARPHLPAQR
jgi:hypothetical protein